MSDPLYTSDNLLNEARVLGSLPSNNASLANDANLIIMANNQMKAVIFPALMGLQENFFVDVVEYDIDSQTFDIPGTSIANKLAWVKIRQPGSNAFTDVVGRLDPSKVPDFVNAQTPNVYGYTTIGNTLHLFPTLNVNSGAQIQIAYFRRPNLLVPAQDCGQVVSINTVSNTVVLDHLPADFTLGASVCCMDSQPNYTTRFDEREITLVSSPNIGLSSVEGIEVGDFISLQGETCLLQIPVEARDLLVQAVITKAQESIADPRWQVSKSVLDQQLADYRSMAKNRVESNPLVYTGQNGIDSCDNGFGWGYRNS